MPSHFDGLDVIFNFAIGAFAALFVIFAVFAISFFVAVPVYVGPVAAVAAFACGWFWADSRG